MPLRRTLAATFLTIAAAGAVLAQNPIEARIQRIANGLVPPVVLEGRPVATTRLADRMRDSRIQGVSIAVFVDGRIDWARGWGFADVESGRKVDERTRFQAASISKPVAAVAALALAARGRLSLDGDVNASLKSWKVPENEFTASSKVTLRRLLSHSAGTTVSGFRGYAKNEAVPTLVQVLDGEKPANSAPVRVDIPIGSRWRYSGGGFSIVQLLVEDETGKPFAQSARELVLEPFGMSRSTFLQPLPPELRRDAATGYQSDGRPIDGNWHVYPEQAAAGLWTTPSDLARFAIELQRIAAGRSNRVLGTDLARQMLQPQMEDYGLGVGVEGTGTSATFGHGGANAGFRCQLVAYRDQASGVVVMTNSDSGGAILQDVVRAVAREYGWPGLAPVTRRLGTADPAAYADFAGRYEIPTRSPAVVLRVETESGRLFASAGDTRSELLPEDATTFFALDRDFRIRFVRDATGRVSEARVWQGTRERTATRVP
ncbi:MAG TPA: serine hydrolase [Vicinamibacterales bacterium]|nr:serine hydrolase [Vicinamibacterales bacterium]